MWEGLARRYLLNPGAEWGDGENRQARKLHRHLETIDKDRERAVDQVISKAKKRIEKRPKAILLPNTGSSGSHWLGGMMAGIPGIINCGEVYFPPGLLERLSKWDAYNRASLLDAIHLGHIWELDSVGRTSLLLNSAHTWRVADALGTMAMVVLLIRDPVEVVLSRTWRKPKYRAAIAPDSTDSEYLERNISFVKRFHSRAGERPWDCVVHYEELRADLLGVLEWICSSLGLHVSKSQLAEIAALNRVDQAGGNKFQGPELDVPVELRARAIQALSEIRDEWGYIAEV
jgi:hypothetical protein